MYTQFTTWQVCAHTWIKENGIIRKTFSVGDLVFGTITEKRIKNQIQIILERIERFYSPIKIEFFIRYWVDRTDVK